MSSLSVAILGKNSRWILKYSLRAVRSALREAGRDVEVVYVDGGSTDGSKELVREVLPQARIIDAPGTNIPEARNIAIRETSGDYLVYWDSDILAPPSALKALLQQDKPIVALTRRDVYVASEEEIQNIMVNLGDDPSPTLYPAPFVVFSVTLFHRDVFRKVGLFDERMTQAEDRDICLRAYCKGFQSFYISTTAYDINKRRLSDVPVTHIRLHAVAPPEDKHRHLCHSPRNGCTGYVGNSARPLGRTSSTSLPNDAVRRQKGR
jgi:glycosyltransferase involved in cell wall biosynthesis